MEFVPLRQGEVDRTSIPLGADLNNLRCPMNKPLVLLVLLNQPTRLKVGVLRQIRPPDNHGVIAVVESRVLALQGLYFLLKSVVVGHGVSFS